MKLHLVLLPDVRARSHNHVMLLLAERLCSKSHRSIGIVGGFVCSMTWSLLQLSVHGLAAVSLSLSPTQLTLVIGI